MKKSLLLAAIAALMSVGAFAAPGAAPIYVAPKTPPYAKSPPPRYLGPPIPPTPSVIGVRPPPIVFPPLPPVNTGPGRLIGPGGRDWVPGPHCGNGQPC